MAIWTLLMQSPAFIPLKSHVFVLVVKFFCPLPSFIADIAGVFSSSSVVTFT